jgi:hypothetical protein
VIAVSYGEGDVISIDDDIESRPSGGSIFVMRRILGTEEEYHRTINADSHWEYFYELLEKFSETMAREQLYESLASYLNPAEIEEHLNYTLRGLI